jgi:hypothetical protein
MSQRRPDALGLGWGALTASSGGTFEANVVASDPIEADLVVGALRSP